jgi:DedD protein
MDKALKQRLVGAVVLIALAVIVLPMIFGGRPSTAGTEARSIELPMAPPDLNFETRRFPVGEESPQGGPSPGASTSANQEEVDRAPTTTRLPQPAEPPQIAAVDPSAPETDEGGAEEPGVPGDQLETEVESVDATEETDGAMDALVAGILQQDDEAVPLRYVVQVASFGNAENAARLAVQLEAAGHAVLLDQVTGDTGRLDRVRVGPYATESEAHGVAEQLRSDFSGITPRIVDMQPEAAGPALASEDPLMRWVVQVGSFSNQENASQLVSRLRASGLSAYDETVSTATETIYRVRVGPYLDRTQALDAERQIGGDLGIDGVVMSSD